MVAVDRPVKAELVWRIRDALELELKDNIPSDDLARVDIVVVGRYTKEMGGIVVSVHSDHPLGLGAWRSGQGKFDHMAEGEPRTSQERPWKFPPESIGGSHWGLVYGTAEVRLLFEDTTPSACVGILETLKQRVASVIDGDDHALCPLTDPFGYALFGLRLYATYGYAGGGENVSADSTWCDFTAFTSHRRNR